MTKESLNQKIISWLQTQGYGVEMNVAQSLNANGIKVVQSWLYDDPESGGSREIDVVGRVDDIVGLLNVWSVIECKKSSKPWILFTSKQTGFNRIHSFAITTDKARETISKKVLKMVENDWFRKDQHLAYGITEAFTSKEDATFKAGMTATKASISIMINETKSTSYNAFSFFFPTVVLDGDLFECYLDNTGNPIVTEIDSGFLVFPIKLSEYNGASVRIVTLKSFEKYCQELLSVYNFLKNSLSDEIIELGTSLGHPSDVLIDYYGLRS